MKVLAVSLHPAIQRTHVYSVMKPGDVNRPREQFLDMSGKGGNAARAAALCGIPAVHLSFWHPDDEKLCRRLSAETGVVLAGVPVTSRLRHCITVVETSESRATELAEAMAPMTSFPQKDFLEVFEKELEGADFVLLAGSSAPGVPAELPALLARRARDCGVKLLADLRGPVLESVLPFSPWAVKINREEWEATFTLPPGLDSWEFFQKTTARLGGRWIVTDGPSEVWYAESGKAGRIQAPAVRSLNPIGCGDFLNGVFLARLIRGDAWREALTKAVRAASLSAETARAAWLDQATLMTICKE